MNDKKIKEAMKQYIETQADNISSESEEKHDLTSLDEKVYAMLGTNQNKHKTAAVWNRGHFPFERSNRTELCGNQRKNFLL